MSDDPQFYQVDGAEVSAAADEVIVFHNGEVRLEGLPEGVEGPNPDFWGENIERARQEKAIDRRENVEGPDPAVWGDRA